MDVNTDTHRRPDEHIRTQTQTNRQTETHRYTDTRTRTDGGRSYSNPSSPSWTPHKARPTLNFQRMRQMCHHGNTSRVELNDERDGGEAPKMLMIVEDRLARLSHSAFLTAFSFSTQLRFPLNLAVCWAIPPSHPYRLLNHSAFPTVLSFE